MSPQFHGLFRAKIVRRVALQIDTAPASSPGIPRHPASVPCLIGAFSQNPIDCAVQYDLELVHLFWGKSKPVEIRNRKRYTTYILFKLLFEISMYKYLVVEMRRAVVKYVAWSELSIAQGTSDAYQQA